MDPWREVLIRGPRTLVKKRLIFLRWVSDGSTARVRGSVAAPSVASAAPCCRPEGWQGRQMFPAGAAWPTAPRDKAARRCGWGVTSPLAVGVTGLPHGESWELDSLHPIQGSTRLARPFSSVSKPAASHGTLRGFVPLSHHSLFSILFPENSRPGNLHVYNTVP